MTNNQACYNEATITEVKRFTVRTKSQAYIDVELITALKVFMIQAPGALRLTAEFFF